VGRRANEITVLRGLFTDEAGNHDAHAIAQLLGLGDDAIYAALARLERDGFVTSERGTNDGRSWRLTVTGISAVLRSMDDLELLAL
jgi:DNA-binding MarR family transcriptional regulator